jgi:hypothetical protein
MKCRIIHNCRSMSPRGLWRKLFWTSETDIVGSSTTRPSINPHFFCVCIILCWETIRESHLPFNKSYQMWASKFINPGNIRLWAGLFWVGKWRGKKNKKKKKRIDTSWLVKGLSTCKKWNVLQSSLHMKLAPWYIESECPRSILATVTISVPVMKLIIRNTFVHAL